MLIANSLAQGSGAQHPMITLVPADPAEMQVNKKGDLQVKGTDLAGLHQCELRKKIYITFSMIIL